MEVSDQPYATATSCPGKRVPVTVEQEGEWASDLTMMF